MTVLERIYQLRKERGWSEYMLSEKSGVAQSTISSWYRKNLTPTVPSIEKICEAYNMTLSQFFNFSGEATQLTHEQSRLLECWNVMTEKQKSLLLEFLETFIQNTD